MHTTPPSLGKVLMVVVVLGLAAVFLAAKYSGDLVNDIRVAGTPMQPSDARVMGADCDRWNYLVSACTITYADPKAAGQRKRLDYLLFGSVAGERIALLQPQSHPGIVTSSIGIAHIGNRVATLIGLLGTIALIVLGVLWRIWPKPAAGEGASHGYDDALERALQAHAQTQASESKPAMSPRPAPPRAGGPAQRFGRRVR
jgi:hypothetical protein